MSLPHSELFHGHFGELNALTRLSVAGVNCLDEWSTAMRTLLR